MNSLSNLTPTYTNLFFGKGGSGLARHDIARYEIFKKQDEKMKSFFWQPNEVDMSGEKSSFNKMTDSEKFVFTSNLRRQILLDSIQGRAPSLAFLPICTDPQLEACIQTWSFFEQIHSISYGHIIRAIYPDPEEVFTGIPAITEIANCATSVGSAYDNLINNPNKENLYLALVSANALEALRFYVSFACTFSFAERGLVEGSAKIVKFVARDESTHLALVSTILKTLPEDDPEFIQIIGDNNAKAISMFEEAAAQERVWVDYLFSKGTVLGLNEKVLNQYIDHLLSKRMFTAGLIKTRTNTQNPLPWIDKWFNNSNVQVAPQEVEISSYLTGSVVNDLSEAKFSF